MISDPAFDARITRNGDRGTLAVLARSTEIVRDRPGPHSWGDVEERTLLVRMPDGRVRPHIETDQQLGIGRGLAHRLRPARLRVAALAIAVATIVVLLLPPPDDAGARALVVTLVVVGLAAAALAVVVLLLLASRSAAVGRTRRGRWARVAAANARRSPGSPS